MSCIIETSHAKGVGGHVSLLFLNYLELVPTFTLPKTVPTLSELEISLLDRRCLAVFGSCGCTIF